jgi:cytochrome b
MRNDPLTTSDAAAPVAHVWVWDLPTRLFHWSIVLLLFTSWLSADQGFMTVHLWSGSALLALLLFRIAWGIVGSTTSRFKDFIHPPRKIASYLRAMVGGEKLLYAGHNPAGGLMVAVLIAVLLAQALTGLFANDGLHFSGPFANWLSEDSSAQVTDIHRMIFNLILLLIWCHVVAVGFYLFVKGDNLVRPMFTGKKPHTHVPAGSQIRFTHLYIALLLLILTVGVVAWITIQGAI